MALSVLALLAIVVPAVLPSAWFVEAPNRRLDTDQPAPYARVPAGASSVEDIIELGQVDDLAVYDDDGGFYFVTISMPNQTLLSWWAAQDDPTVKFITYEDKYGFQTPFERQVLSRQSMATSEQIAQYVALSRLGFDAQLEPGEVIVNEVLCLEVDEDAGECAEWPPSDELVNPGDTVIRVGDTDIPNREVLGDVLATYKPGDEVELTVLRGDEEVSGTVELIEAPDEPGRPLIGVSVLDTPTVELPFELDFDTRNTGGPSAGLAFALALTDELSEGELTGGVRVAVTGTIDLNGDVGAIGGLVQKASAVEQAGIDIFLVPAAQGDEQIAEARAAVDNVAIVPVSTFDDALAVLQQLGGDPLPSPPTPDTADSSAPPTSVPSGGVGDGQQDAPSTTDVPFSTDTPASTDTPPTTLAPVSTP